MTKTAEATPTMKAYLTAAIGVARFGVADATALPLADGSVDLVMTSPPYLAARTYGIGAQRKLDAWHTWMLDVIREALRVCRGPVVVNCAGQTVDRNYQPGPEGLLYLAHKAGIHAYRPCYWHRVGIPGSGGDQWFRADVEHVLCFKRPGKLPWTNNTAMGHAPKWAPGGEISHRLIDGARANSRSDAGKRRRDAVAAGHGRTMSARDSSQWANTDDRKAWNYLPPVRANPGNVIVDKVGGGKLGHPLASENEAPFTERLAEWFIASLCPIGGIVLDPFSGSGTTACVAARLGRVGLGFDVRESQALLGRRRHATPFARKSKRPAKVAGQGTLFQEAP